jgi:hypothetical protein
MSSIFLSHNSNDKDFVRKLKKNLKMDGISVWFDEDEMLVGDSLIKKISDGIDDMEYLGVIISNNSNNSSWVQKEVAIAITREINGKRVIVLPILLERCDIPVFLKDKIYADFTENFDTGYKALFKVLTKTKDVVKKVKILCEGTTSRGRACTKEVSEGLRFCHSHDPANQKKKLKRKENFLKKEDFFKEKLFPIIFSALFVALLSIGGFFYKKNNDQKEFIQLLQVEIKHKIGWLKICRDAVIRARKQQNLPPNSYPDLDVLPQNSIIYRSYISKLHLLPATLIPEISDFFDYLDRTEQSRQECNNQLNAKNTDFDQECVKYESFRDDSIRIGERLLLREEFKVVGENKREWFPLAHSSSLEGSDFKELNIKLDKIIAAQKIDFDVSYPQGYKLFALDNSGMVISKLDTNKDFIIDWSRAHVSLGNEYIKVNLPKIVNIKTRFTMEGVALNISRTVGIKRFIKIGEYMLAVNVLDISDSGIVCVLYFEKVDL